MNSIVNLSLDNFLLYALVLMRMGGLVTMSPFFGGQELTQRARLGLVVMLSFIIYPTAAESLGGQVPPGDLASLGIMALREVLVGLVLGLAGSFMFCGPQLAGELIGQQIGFSMSNVLDPMQDQEIGIISYMNFVIALMIFLSLDMHLAFLKVMALSYDAAGLGQAVFSPLLAQRSLWMFGEIYAVAVQAGAPILILMLMLNMVQGFISRTMPQFNIMAVGLPSQTVLGLLALGFTIRPFCSVVGSLCGRLVHEVQSLVWAMSPSLAN